MGLFDFIFGKKEAAPKEYEEPAERNAEPDQELMPEQEYYQEDTTNERRSAADNINYLEDAEVALGVVMPLAFAKHWDKIKKTKLSYVAIEATESDTLSLTQSKFGHYPYLPAGYDYPKDSEGRYMYPLAQINFSDVPPLAGYPTSGYLQFYISGFDDAYGLDFSDPRSQKDSRVIYFEADAIKEHIQDFSFLDEVMNLDSNPVYKPHALQFSAGDEFVGLSDVRYELQLNEFNVDDVVESYPHIARELEDYVWRNFQGSGHKIGGYATFTQEDPRGGNDLEDYILLLQIDTDDHIMWGDSGVANFFIHPDDLAKKDFSKVMYNWDCC